VTIQTDSELKHIIVTRPAAQAGSLLRRLNELQNNVVNYSNIPLLDIQPLDFEIPVSRLFDGIIFISSHAADYFYKKCDTKESQKFLTNAILVAVGDNTAKKVQQLTDLPVIYPQQMNAEGLLKLPQLQAVKGQSWLIIKGKGGRQLIKDSLLCRNAKVTEVDVYERKLPDLVSQKQVLRAQASHPAWLITSAEALTNLYSILGLANKKKHVTQVIISSDRLAEQARTKGFTVIGQSKGASELQLVECVKTLLDSKIQQES
jgi:uroporphyrinogen-III synthase